MKIFQAVKYIALQAIYSSKLSNLFFQLYKAIFPLPVRILYSHQVIGGPANGLRSILLRQGHFSVNDFDHRIEFLCKHYKFATLNEYATWLFEGRKPSAPTIILTFDDGHRNLYKEAFPILKKHSVPATIFLTTGCIGNDNVLLNDQLAYMMGKSIVENFRIPEVSPDTYYLNTLEERHASLVKISSLLKRIPHEEKTHIVAKLQKILNISINDIKKDIKMLTWDEIKEMRDSGLVSFGAHTVSHPILTQISSAQAMYEIYQSKKTIDEHLHQDTKFFAYPNGSVSDYNHTIKTIVRESGYKMAFTTSEYSALSYNPYEIPRFGFHSGDSFRDFAIRLSGVSDLIGILKGSHKIRAKTDSGII